MAKRGSKQDVGAKQDAPLFEYSRAEWSNIEAAARAILPNDKPLPNEVRMALVDRARVYQSRTRLALAKDNQDWQKVARLSERLHQALRVASEQSVEIIRVVQGPREAKYVRRWLEAYLEKLLEIKDHAEAVIIPAKEMNYRPARVWYQSEVLEIWVRLGGQLRFSRSKRGPQGPLIRFFQAVTGPVMGASAPSPESIPDIVRRERFRGRRLAVIAAKELQKG
jgi:hypothetical protein